MGKTIIQTIGPLYGEVVNGTVFGRPNGSVYVPATNVIDIGNYSSKIKNFVVSGGYRVRFVDDSGTGLRFSVVAQSQDISSNIRVVLASDSDLQTVLAQQNLTAGSFNVDGISNIVLNYELTAETTYYVGVLLMNNGVPVATKSVEVVAE